MTLGSLFDGIGTWQEAARRNGIKTIWSSEIEKFPLAVTARHFPDTVQLGDINTITDAPHVDIITAGTPCQDLSIAGKRSGIHGERSGLFFKAIVLVRQIRPRFFVWENVLGAFSSNGGNDFRAVLEEILEEPVPLPEHGWSNAGLVDGKRSQVAWRVCDAQFWGVPQRRKRIFLVADFAGRRAAEILFEPAGMSRNSAASTGEERHTAARNRTDSDFAVYEHHWKDCRITKCSNVALTVAAMYGTGGLNTPLVVYGIRAGIIGRQVHNGGRGMVNENLSFTLTTVDRHAVAYGIDRATFNQGINAQFKPNICKELQPSLTAKGPAAVCHLSVVRRLTPLECERLQGLPDRWTEGGSDAARYKAIGNGMALPIAEWIMKRIKEAST